MRTNEACAVRLHEPKQTCVQGVAQVTESRTAATTSDKSRAGRQEKGGGGGGGEILDQDRQEGHLMFL